jgi:RHS repeat-associated protein
VAYSGIYRVGTRALRSLLFGNTLTETRTFDGRNVPTGITVSSNRLAWTYTTDREGNPTAITQTQPAAEARTFGYQDFAYFLTSADGPWGTLDWSYDKIGNRLTQVRNGLAPGDLYTYLPNAATPTPGNTATLDRIDLAVGGTKDYAFGPAGHLERIDESLGATVYDHTAEGQLGTITRGGDQPGMSYDGRSFLRQATTANPTIFQDGFDTGNLSCWGFVAGGEEGDGPTRGETTCFTPAPGGAVTTATYGSEGLLYSVERKASPTSTATRFHLFYFAGRPVAEVEIPPTGAPTWTYLTTDHLGTPILATRSSNTERWRGGFEPFGTDWRAGTASGASENGVFLRLPGQWVDGVWGTEEAYNVARWYQANAGLYLAKDPLTDRLLATSFSYAGNAPLGYTDPLGLCKVDLRFNQIGGNPWYHAYVVACENDGACRVYRSGPSSDPPIGPLGGLGLLTKTVSGATDVAQGCCGPSGPPAHPVRSPWGAIAATIGPWQPGGPDWPRVGEGTTGIRLLDNDQPCGCIEKCLGNNLLQIDNANIPYNGLTSNSNATAYTLLKNCGLSPPAPPVLAPGYNFPLNNFFPR